MRSAAKKHLAAPKEAPRKPFVSEASWALIRTRAVLRRGGRRVADSESEQAKLAAVEALLKKLLCDDHCKTASARHTCLARLTVTLFASIGCPPHITDGFATGVRQTLSALRDALKDSIATDKVELLEKTAAAASNSFRCSPAEAWRNIKVLAAWGGRRWGAGYQPLRRDAAGNLAEPPRRHRQH